MLQHHNVILYRNQILIRKCFFLIVRKHELVLKKVHQNHHGADGGVEAQGLQILADLSDRLMQQFIEGPELPC